MLYALGHPTSFLVLLLAFVVAVTLHGWVQSVAAVRAGEREPVLQQRTRPDPRRHVDPFGAIAGAVSGTGWSRQTELSTRQSRSALVGVLLAGSVANAVAGVASLVVYRLAGGPAVLPSLEHLQRGGSGLELGLLALYLLGLSNVAVAALSLVPLPPLPGGRLLFALAPTSPGWQQARYRLLEQNIGTAVLLALLLIPLGGPQPLLPTVLDTLLAPVLQPLVSG
ncbi:MAG TPA: hypothetical protein VNU26_01800 [Mycobacteriales bacterium]|nr:hypothetical protein [Mycobacteriales bacterium]